MNGDGSGGDGEVGTVLQEFEFALVEIQRSDGRGVENLLTKIVTTIHGDADLVDTLVSLPIGDAVIVKFTRIEYPFFDPEHKTAKETANASPPFDLRLVLRAKHLFLSDELYDIRLALNNSSRWFIGEFYHSRSFHFCCRSRSPITHIFNCLSLFVSGIHRGGIRITEYPKEVLTKG